VEGSFVFFSVYLPLSFLADDTHTGSIFTRVYE